MCYLDCSDDVIARGLLHPLLLSQCTTPTLAEINADLTIGDLHIRGARDSDASLDEKRNHFPILPFVNARSHSV